MKINDRYPYAVLSSLYTLAVFLFFLTAYSAHVHFQEQFQLFQFTWRYFIEVVSAPGGFADWAGRFLTQFFWWGAVGAAILALTVLAVQLLCWHLSERRTPLAYVLSFIPSVLCWAFLCDENALLGGAVALVIVLLAALPFRRPGAAAFRSAVIPVLIPVLYFLAGPVVAVFAVVSMRNRKPWLWIVSALVLAACPVVASACSLLPASRFFYGLHYFRYPIVAPKLLWFSAAAAVVFLIAGCFRFKDLRHGVSAVAAAVFLIALVPGTWFFIRFSSDFSDEKIMSYDWMARNADWDGICSAAFREAPASPMQTAYLNLAMAQKGTLADRMFDFYQKGFNGLIPPLEKDHFSAFPSGEAYYHLGMASDALRIYFEEQEAIPDFQSSIRCCKRIADCLIINEQYAAASKYLEILRHTLVYHRWAKDPDTDAGEYERLRSMRVPGENILPVNHTYAEIFSSVYNSNRSNRLAYEYMMATLMLDKDIEGIVANFPREEFDRVPKYFQQATLIYLVNRDKSLEKCPEWVTRETAGQMVEFYKAYSANRDPEYMKKHFGRTLWYYLVYRNIE